MRDIAKIWSRNYNSVNAYDFESVESNFHNQSKTKSLKASRIFNRNFNIIDSLFNERNSERNIRLPTGEFLINNNKNK